MQVSMSGAGLKMPIHALEMEVLRDMISSMGSSNNETREITSYDIEIVNIGLPVEAQCDPRCSKVQKQEKLEGKYSLESTDLRECEICAHLRP